MGPPYSYHHRKLPPPEIRAYYGVISHHCPLIDGGSSDRGSSEGHGHDGFLRSNNFEIPRVTPGWRQRPVDREGNDCRGRH